MIFHSVEEIESSVREKVPDPRGLQEIQTAATPGKRVRRGQVRPGAMLWATGTVLFLVLAAFVAHQMRFDAGETVLLNLVVAITSASVGAFLGEHIAIDKLLR